MGAGKARSRLPFENIGETRKSLEPENSQMDASPDSRNGPGFVGAVFSWSPATLTSGLPTRWNKVIVQSA
jgi:hypothetical protein